MHVPEPPDTASVREPSPPEPVKARKRHERRVRRQELKSNKVGENPPGEGRGRQAWRRARRRERGSGAPAGPKAQAPPVPAPSPELAAAWPSPLQQQLEQPTTNSSSGPSAMHTRSVVGLLSNTKTNHDRRHRRSKSVASSYR